MLIKKMQLIVVDKTMREEHLDNTVINLFSVMTHQIPLNSWSFVRRLSVNVTAAVYSCAVLKVIVYVTRSNFVRSPPEKITKKRQEVINDPNTLT